MYVVESLRLNKFVEVSIPRNRDLYARVGGRIPSMGTSGFVSELGQNKLDILAADNAALEAEYAESAQKLKPNQMPLNSK